MQRGTSKGEVVEYRGNRYRRYPESKNRSNRLYFYATEPRRGFLHRHVWEDENGPIPPGHDIHHDDKDTSNNSPGNLICLSKKEHRKEHPFVGESLEKQLVHLAAIRPKAVAWHSSADGKEWHSANGKRCWNGRKPVHKLCAACGSEFNAFFARAMFCSGGCKQRGVGGGASKRGRYAPSGEPVACKCCHRQFVSKWPETAAYCSKACGMRYRDRGAFGPDESPKPYRKPSTRLLCERLPDP